MNVHDAFLAYILSPVIAAIVGLMAAMAYLTWNCPTILPC